MQYSRRDLNFCYVQEAAVMKVAEWFKNFTERPFCFNISKAKNKELLIDLIAEDPAPVLDYLFGGCVRLKRVRIKGSGTKRDPFKAYWGEDYYDSIQQGYFNKG